MRKVGNPDGIEEIATVIASRITCELGRPRSTAITTMMATAAQARIASRIVRERSSFCSGDFSGVTLLSIPAILPISVPVPVATTRHLAVPRVTEVFWKTIDVRSPKGVSGSGTAAGPLSTGALSPVRPLSTISREADSRTRPSAGARSPGSRRNTSPGTRSTASIVSS